MVGFRRYVVLSVIGLVAYFLIGLQIVVVFSLGLDRIFAWANRMGVGDRGALAGYLRLYFYGLAGAFGIASVVIAYSQCKLGVRVADGIGGANSKKGDGK